MRGACGCDCGICLHVQFCEGCSLCEKPFCKGICSGCMAICPDRPGALHMVSRDRRPLTAEPCRRQLPALLPVLPDRLTEPLDAGAVIAVHGGNMFTSNGEHVARVYRNKGVHETLNIAGNVELVLHWYVKDRTLEGFWDNRSAVYSELGQFTWRAVITPNFSVYEDVARLDHLYNMDRSWIVYNEMLERGLPAVPDVTWHGRADLDRWAERIVKYQIPQIAFSWQTVSTGSKASNTWIHYLMGYRYLRERIPGNVDIVTAGITAPARLQKIRAISRGHRISVINQTAYLQSRRGILAEKPTTPAEELTLNEIFIGNLQHYAAAYKEIGLEDDGHA